MKRILKNLVYLGHTLLGKSRKVSVKSKKKVSVPQDAWTVTENTYPPLVAQTMLGSRKARKQSDKGDTTQEVGVPGPF